ncbi:MAG: hypothetical protein CVV42_11695 [Candidatus Riflebacteria bacterium HGW-Riflebacteria-2]|jgi:hypothetical protein|nr:MAG: hypothetical protein CVV42_11695 [Candidatus Riflebacteria bacterium HGW-Riflebacteria-2]
MNRYSPAKLLGIIFLAVFLLAVPVVFAVDDLDDFGGLDDLGGDTAASPDAPVAAEGGDGMVAESPSSGSVVDTSKMTEMEQVDSLINKFSFAPEIPNKDPFKPIVEKKVVLPPVRTVQPVSRPSDSKPQPPPVKPIKVFVTGIVGNEGARLAVIKFEDEEHTVSKDQIVDGKFKVVDIQNDRIVVYSNKEQRRHTFKIGGDEKE